MGKLFAKLALLLTVTILFCQGLLSLVCAQEPIPGDLGGWSAPFILYEELEGAKNGRLRLAADPFGNIHLIWYREAELEEDRTILYSRWDGQVWTPPVDILLSPEGDVTYRAALAVDDLGRLHTVWSGNRPESLYYSWAWYDQADSAANWSVPVIIGPKSSEVKIAAEGENILHVVYAKFGEEIYYRTSHDGGENWEKPVQISQVFSLDEGTDEPQIFVSPTGILHVVWNGIPLPNGYPPSGVFYAHSLDSGVTWSIPQKLSGVDMGQANVAVAGDGTVHIAWNGRAGIGGRFHIWSSDNGLTWSSIENLAPGDSAGLTGMPSFTVDGNGTLHLIYTTVEQGGIMYATWTFNHLTKPNILVPYNSEWYGENSIMLAAFGDQLHLIIPNDRISHFWRMLNAETIIPRSTPTLNPIVTPEITTIPGEIDPVTQLPTPSVTIDVLSPSNYSGQQSMPIVMAVIPSLALVVAITILHRSRTRRQ